MVTLLPVALVVGQPFSRWSPEHGAQVMVLAALTLLIFWPTGTLIIALPPARRAHLGRAPAGHQGAVPRARRASRSSCRCSPPRVGARSPSRPPTAHRTRWPPAPPPSSSCCARRSSRCPWPWRRCSRTCSWTGCAPTSSCSAATSPSRSSAWCSSPSRRSTPPATPRTETTRPASTCGSSTSTTPPSGSSAVTATSSSTPRCSSLVELGDDFDEALEQTHRGRAGRLAGRGAP